MSYRAGWSASGRKKMRCLFPGCALALILASPLAASEAPRPAASRAAPRVSPAPDPAPDPAPEADPAARRMQRQISIFEKVIDQTLIDSQHALVTGAPNCRGLRLGGYGVLFMVELSPILTGDDILHFRFKPDGSYEVEYDGEEEAERKRIEGRTRSRGRRDGGEESDRADADIEYVDPAGEDSAAVAGDLPPAFRQLVRDWDPKSAARLADPEREEVLALVREELLETLRDYGHTLAGIGPEEHIGIAIFPSDLDWRGGPGSRTILQVKRREVDAFNAGQITPEVFRTRVEVVTQ